MNIMQEDRLFYFQHWKLKLLALQKFIALQNAMLPVQLALKSIPKV